MLFGLWCWKAHSGTHSHTTHGAYEEKGENASWTPKRGPDLRRVRRLLLGSHDSWSDGGGGGG